ncbi:transposase [Pontibacter sp. HSC-14F20]|uniref:IS110 family transposase n=1 Tax=Pontibacter sp. HSC-14F20 TaxID=2864136 RepID=UPI001C737E9D|nr:transposase [Pontibacter sp. HSC-14F20]MBX0333142.1 transposase [Pontibacter sp. HSC-14F20]
MELQVLKQALGIDVAKDTLSLCLGTLNLDLEKEFTASADVTNDAKGYQKIEKWLNKLKVQKEKLVVVMEATGVYYEALALYLHQRGYTISVMQSGRVKRYAQSLSQRSKTDALDSRMLAMLGCERKLPLWSPPDKTLRHLKALSRERSFLLKEKNVEKNRLHAF